ncbi:hypothetical protein J25TS5_31020 [Paenibacillus faecis]|uniref:hypothetical protein n=1 Tax=Paenibacillus faecis TaxID=862114 RepID=UPI001B038E08|nr:hypothetical protein [Paenibacillus faecis]GIO86170.1 hypothetical protein J25TS5_31020 [Paenibacillus faecis]
MQKTDTQKVEQLSSDLSRLRQNLEHALTHMSGKLSSLISQVETSYPEPSVRDAVREVTAQLGEMMRLAKQLDDRLYDKVRALGEAASAYLQTEREVFALAQAKRGAAFTLKSFALGLASRFDRHSRNNVAEARNTPLSLLQTLKGALLEVRDISLKGRLSPAQADKRIGSLLDMLDYGSPEAQRWARGELEHIAGALEGIARDQSAYRIYETYQNEKYMAYIHKRMEQQRSRLADLGVAEEWYGEGRSLSSFYKGSPLNACDYNPLKNDFSRMPVETELRFVIAAGLYNPAYRKWAALHYPRIEAAVRKGVEQRKRIEQILEQYNKEASAKDIRKMQEYLKKMNLYHGEITGKYNLEFLVAVGGYQHIGNTVSSVAAVRRDMFHLDRYQFEVNGKITQELLDLAAAERGLGIWNNPDVKAGGLAASMTLVGVGDGIASQLLTDTWDTIQFGHKTNPVTLQYWTETVPAYYDFGKAVYSGDMTFEDIKAAIGEAAAAEFVVPFRDIRELYDKVLSGKASYEESQRFGRALAKAVEVAALVKAAAQAGAKVSSKVTKQVDKTLSKLEEPLKPPALNPERTDDLTAPKVVDLGPQRERELGDGRGAGEGKFDDIDDIIEKDKKITIFDNPDDPFRDVLGSGSKSHPEEWNKIINELEENGVEVVYRERGLGYGPLRKGEAGQVLLDPNASMSALRHEYSHFLEAKAKGFPSAAESYQDWEGRIADELKAYTIEIEEAKRLGLDNVVKQLQKNFEAEKQYIIDRFKPIDLD